VGDVGKSLHRINAVVDGRQDDHQSTVVEVEGKVNNNCISILIDLGATLSYVAPGVVDSNKLKKVKHTKSWLVQLATGTKRKVTDFISDCELQFRWSKHKAKSEYSTIRVLRYNYWNGLVRKS
jgi:hypothetical protein